MIRFSVDPSSAHGRQAGQALWHPQACFTCATAACRGQHVALLAWVLIPAPSPGALVSRVSWLYCYCEMLQTRKFWGVERNLHCYEKCQHHILSVKGKINKRLLESIKIISVGNFWMVIWKSIKDFVSPACANKVSFWRRLLRMSFTSNRDFKSNWNTLWGNHDPTEEFKQKHPS